MIQPVPNLPERRSEDDAGCHAGLAAVSRSLRFAMTLLLVLMGGLLCWYLLFGGYFTVGPQENVLVFRFGRPVGCFKEGWHWVFPQPVHELVRVPVSQRTLEIGGFWPSELAVMAATPEPPKGGPLKPGADGYLLTGDANIVHTHWTITYHVADPETYYRSVLCPSDPRKPDESLRDPVTGTEFGPRGPETMLRRLLENAVLHEAAGQTVETLLYRDSAAFNRQVALRLARLVQEAGLGVEVDAVVLTDKSPPAMVMDSFQQVIGAMQESQNEILRARREATTIRGEAVAEAARLQSEAESYRKRAIADISAENAYFRRILGEFRANPETVLFALYADTLAGVLPKANDRFIIRANREGRQELRLMLNPEPAAPKPEGGDHPGGTP